MYKYIAPSDHSDLISFLHNEGFWDKDFVETSRKNVLFLMDFQLLTILDEDDSTPTPNMSSYESQVSTVQVNFVNH